MPRLLSLLLAALTALSFVVPSTAAVAFSPLGTWQTTTGESRYKVVSCGEGGQICAKLIWLRADARTPENLPYLNTYVVKGAVPTQANRWSGTVYYEGERIGGSMIMLDGDSLRLTGCKLIACTTLDFTRL